MKYSLDANVLIGMHRLYSRDLFGSLWLAMETAAAAGEIGMCRVAAEELRHGRDNLHEWAKSLPGFIQEPTAKEFEIVTDIAHRYPGWATEKKNGADPFVVAHAAATGATIVTGETKKGAGTLPKNQKIPNVAEHYGANCITFLDLMRHLDWSF